jgi:chromatin remodeling complex protein RSC6
MSTRTDRRSSKPELSSSRRRQRTVKSEAQVQSAVAPDVSEVLEEMPPVPSVKQRAPRTKKPREPERVAEPERERPEASVKVEEQAEPVVQEELSIRDELEVKFNELLSSLDSELNESKSNPHRDVSLKTWRELSRSLRSLMKQSLKVVKHQKKKRQNVNSGFSKQFNISDSLAKFTGWSPSDMKSRNDVTNFLCSYIRENKLKNPEFGSEILPDDRLSSLLGKRDGRLTYATMQKYIGQHLTSSA